MTIIECDWYYKFMKWRDGSITNKCMHYETYLEVLFILFLKSSYNFLEYSDLYHI